MTLMTNARPSYYSPSEKRAFARGFRHGHDGQEPQPRSYPAAYAKGFAEGSSARSENA